MTEIGEVSVRKRRSRQEIKRLVAEFETSGLRRSEFCQKHSLGLGTLQRGLRRSRMKTQGQSEAKRTNSRCSPHKFSDLPCIFHLIFFFEGSSTHRTSVGMAFC